LKELNGSMQEHEASQKMLNNLRHENEELHAQLLESIDGCSDVIVSIEAQFADCPESANPSVSIGQLEEQLREVTTKNRALQVELLQQKQALEDFQARQRDIETETAKAQQLQQQRDWLRARLKELTSCSVTFQQLEQADQDHANELKRHRQDLERLFHEKEELRQQLQDNDSERRELQDNFLYVKQHLDKWQTKQAEDAADNGSTSLQRHQQVLAKATEERHRLSMRLEVSFREAEREKAYHEQQLDRVSHENARLTEERDRIEADVKRLSQVYQASLCDFQVEPAEAGEPPAAHPSNGRCVSPEEFARLREKLAEVDIALQIKEAENELLMRRLKRLALH